MKIILPWKIRRDVCYFHQLRRKEIKERLFIFLRMVQKYISFFSFPFFQLRPMVQKYISAIPFSFSFFFLVRHKTLVQKLSAAHKVFTSNTEKL